MPRPSIPWLLFALCLSLFVCAMLWITVRSLSLDEQRREAALDAERQERVRLALWRMEAEASALIVRESARPSHQYRPFLPVESLQAGTVQVPSPLLGTTPDLVKLHFQCGTSAVSDTLCSPQLPKGNDEALARQHYSVNTPTAEVEGRMNELRGILETHRDWEKVAGFGFPRIAGKAGMAQLRNAVGAAPEWAYSEQRWRDDTLVKKPIQDQVAAGRIPTKKTAAGEPPPAPEPETGEMRALWLGSELVLVRPVRETGVAPRMQGVWMDWSNLQARLIAAARDLLPDARLEPVVGASVRADDWMRLVSLPVRLVPGAVPADAAPPVSGLKSALFLAWTCLIGAAVAIGFVLHRAMQLSERRASFVSAVTHELRTPLTTFRLYSEMLADGVVTDEAQRISYLRTLQVESNRLMHLVENVLSFSRIERGRGAPQLETLTAGDLLDRILPRLEERATAAGLTLIVEATQDARSAMVKTDALVVEQILFNLTDNACKYAAPQSVPTDLSLSVGLSESKVRFTLRDFGPGLSSAQQKKLFQPFSKSATEAAHSAPGVGLVLALSRRLARQVGGDLRHDASSGRGAAFCLSLLRAC
jgi:signal transduction histidine kinase